MPGGKVVELLQLLVGLVSLAVIQPLLSLATSHAGDVTCSPGLGTHFQHELVSPPVHSIRSACRTLRNQRGNPSRDASL